MLPFYQIPFHVKILVDSLRNTAMFFLEVIENRDDIDGVAVEEMILIRHIKQPPRSHLGLEICEWTHTERNELTTLAICV